MSFSVISYLIEHTEHVTITMRNQNHIKVILQSPPFQVLDIHTFWHSCLGHLSDGQRCRVELLRRLKEPKDVVSRCHTSDVSWAEHPTSSNLVRICSFWILVWEKHILLTRCFPKDSPIGNEDVMVARFDWHLRNIWASANQSFWLDADGCITYDPTVDLIRKPFLWMWSVPKISSN